MALKYTLIVRFITISETLKCKKEMNILEHREYSVF